jgi:hypothetical protein
LPQQGVFLPCGAKIQNQLLIYPAVQQYGLWGQRSNTYTTLVPQNSKNTPSNRHFAVYTEGLPQIQGSAKVRSESKVYTFITLMTSYPSLTETEYTGCYRRSFTTLKDYTNLYRGHTQLFELNCHNVAKHSKSDARGTVIPKPPPRAHPQLKSRWLLSQVQSVLVRRNGVCYTSSKEISHSVSQGTSH